MSVYNGSTWLPIDLPGTDADGTFSRWMIGFTQDAALKNASSALWLSAGII